MARILIIDDDHAVRTVLRLTLVLSGYAVTEATNGREGLAVLDRGDRPDLVLTDIIMPDLDGLELLWELRQRGSPVKVIAMSGGSRVGANDHLDKARLLGAQRVLAKPFTREVLLLTIREVLTPGVAKANKA